MIDPSVYLGHTYDSKERFISYWHQIDEILTLGLAPVLEIGIGNGLVTRYLRDRHLQVTTLDINDGLRPDRVGSVLSIPFPERAFQVVACCEVLEHLPYEDFGKALAEIHRVSDAYVVLSLPDATRAHRLEVWVPRWGVFRRLIQVPRGTPKRHVYDGHHYWEIGKDGYPLGRIVAAMQHAGFEVQKTFRVFENPYHRFFTLKKMNLRRTAARGSET